MANDVLIPTPLRAYAGKQDIVQVEGETVGELLQNLTAKYSELRIISTTRTGDCGASSTCISTTTTFVIWDKEATAVKEGDTLSIVPSVAGGADE